MSRSLEAVIAENGAWGSFPWISTLVFGGGGLGLLGYAAWWVVHRLGHIRGEDLAPLGIAAVLLAIGAFSAWGGFAQRRDVLALTTRPVGEIVWVYLRQGAKSGTSLVIADQAGAVLFLKVGGRLGVLWTDAEYEALAREASARWPHATAGYSAALEQRYRADPSSLRRG